MFQQLRNPPLELLYKLPDPDDAIANWTILFTLFFTAITFALNIYYSVFVVCNGCSSDKTGLSENNVSSEFFHMQLLKLSLPSWLPPHSLLI